MDAAEVLDLVASLNSDSASKQKLVALAKLADIALNDPDAVLSCLDATVDDAMDRMLADKADAYYKFGTALGRVHETVLLLLLRATRYQLTTAQLLDLMRGDVPLSITVLKALTQVTSHEDECIAAALELLCGFAHPDTYADLEGWRCTTGLDGQGTVVAFAERLGTFAAALISSKLLLGVVPLLAQRIFPVGRCSKMSELSAPKRGCLRAFCKLACNSSLMLYSSTDDLRSELAAASSVGKDLLLPALVALAADTPSPGSEGPPPSSMLSLTLRTSVLLCFRAPAAVASIFRASAIIAALVPHCLLPHTPKHAAHLLALAINIDVLKPLSDPNASNKERHTAEDLLAALQVSLADLPGSIIIQNDAPFYFCLPDVPVPYQCIVLAVPTSSPAAALIAFAALQEGLEHHSLPVDLLTDLLVAIEGGDRVARHGGEAMSELRVLPVARDATTCHDIHFLLQQALSQAQPDTSAALALQLRDLALQSEALEKIHDELREAAGLPPADSADGDHATRTLRSQAEVLEAALADGETSAKAYADCLGIDLSAEMEEAAAEAMTVAEGEDGPSKFRLLGDLPQLTPGGALNRPAKHATDGRPRRPRRGAGRQKGRRAEAAVTDEEEGKRGRDQMDGVPEEFCCALNAHIMRLPMRTPSGLVFEAETIEAWLTENAKERSRTICPVSGAPLQLSELHVDYDLKKRIHEFHIRRSLEDEV